MTTITIERAILDRLIDAWDSTVLPKSRDGMMQERMEDLRAAMAVPATAPEPVAWIPPERDGEFHHEHESITAYRTPIAGWWPVYRHSPATAPEPVAWMFDWYAEPDDGGDGLIRDWLTTSYDEAHSPTMGCHNIRPLYLRDDA